MNVVQIIKMIITLGPLLVELMKMARTLGVQLKKLIDSLRAPADATDEEKLDADLQIQKTILKAVKEKAEADGICAPDNLVNLAALLAHEMDKGRDEKLMAECGKGPISADEGRFNP